jgi:dihydrofolate reductase
VAPESKVVVQAAMSLDGFIAGPADAMDWVFEYAAPQEFPEIVEATGAMLSGRRSYNVGLRDAGKPSGEAYGGAWHRPSFVLTHDPPPDPGVTFLCGDIGAAAETARAAAGGKDLVVVGADVASQCLERGLVDELLVMVLPVLLGAGTPLYKPEKATRVELEAITSSSSGSVQLLRYGVREMARPAARSAPVVS